MGWCIDAIGTHSLNRRSSADISAAAKNGSQYLKLLLLNSKIAKNITLTFLENSVICLNSILYGRMHRIDEFSMKTELCEKGSILQFQYVIKSVFVQPRKA